MLPVELMIFWTIVEKNVYLSVSYVKHLVSKLLFHMCEVLIHLMLNTCLTDVLLKHSLHTKSGGQCGPVV